MFGRTRGAGIDGHAAKSRAAAGMAVHRCMALLLLGASGVAAAKAKAKPSADCHVTVTTADGETEQRDCYISDGAGGEPGTLGRFESCTQ